MNKKIIPVALMTMLMSSTGLMANQRYTDNAAQESLFSNEAEMQSEGKTVSLGSAGELTISGYLQAQWQLAQQKGAPGLAQGGNFGSDLDNRFMVRRGRIKFTYTKGIVQMVVQPDFTEKGVSIKDAYLSVTSPSKVISGQMGVFDRPFGYEISYSSSRRESPERSRVFLSLFPGERDLGAMVTLRGAKGSWLNNFTLNAGLFNGNGIGSETDSRKDFIGRLAWLHSFGNTDLGAAFSYYYGGVLNMQDENYTYTKGEGFVQHDNVSGKYELRQYMGLALQFTQKWAIGKTNIRAEYLWGQNPGTAALNANPGGNTIGNSGALYMRNFRGYYVYLVQQLGQTDHSLVLKYDNYDPNIRVGRNQIGQLAGTGAADVAYNTFGVGYLWDCTSNLRLMAYYDFVFNEKCPNLANADSPLKDYARNIKDNVLTLRVQVKF